jgi:hypothetical protein
MSWDQIRRAAAGDSRDHWERAMDSLNEAGFPDSQMELDTGHRIWMFHQGDGNRRASDMPPGFNVHVWHPNMLQHHGNTNLSAHLGHDPDQVGPMMRRVFSHPEAMQHLMGQMQGDPGLGRTYLDMTQMR